MEHKIQIIAEYMNGLLILVILFATFFGLKNFKKIGFYSIFIIITASSLIQMVYSILILNIHGIEAKNSKVSLSINLYILIELAIITYFFYFKIKNQILRNILFISNSLLFFVMLFFVLTDNNFINEHYSRFVAIEAILSLLGCIFVFVQILDEDSNEPLLNSPDFIITSGLFFFFSFTCPFYLLSYYLKDEILLHKCLSTLNNLVYVILYISFIIAYVCKIRTNKLY